MLICARDIGDEDLLVLQNSGVEDKSGNLIGKHTRTIWDEGDPVLLCVVLTNLYAFATLLFEERMKSWSYTSTYRLLRCNNCL